MIDFNGFHRGDGRAIVAHELKIANREADRIAQRDAPRCVTPAKRIAELISILHRLPGNDCASQRARIVAALETGSVSTHEARAYLDVMGVSARIAELRQQGSEIVSLWARFETIDGRLHRFKQHHLVAKA